MANEQDLMVYSAHCTWCAPISKASKLESGIPCCPHCKSVLFQMERADWDKGVVGFIASNGDHAYPSYLEWVATTDRCYRTYKEARAAFNAGQLEFQDKS
jgi:hypothetical protein